MRLRCYDPAEHMRIVIVGTGTSVGKTHLGVALVAAVARRGKAVCGLKPVESGVPAGMPGEDAAALATVSTFHVKHPPPYAFPDPVSPHLAARRAGVLIELERIRSWVDEHPAPWLLIETAGALLSPLSVGLSNIDLAAALDPDRWILVGMDRLGVLHDVAACRLVMGARHLPAPLVVLQAPDTRDASTGTNAEELRLLGIAEDVITLPRGAPLSEEYQRAADVVLDQLN